MALVFNILRIATAILLPLGTIILAQLAVLHIRRGEGDSPLGDEQCIQCQLARPGAVGQFHYSAPIAHRQPRAAKNQLNLPSTPILGSETHFVCDHCARKYIITHIIQLVLMVLVYPLYLYAFIPLFAKNGVFAGILIETLLVVVSVAGLTSAFDLYRAITTGETPLAEARDRVAISKRKNSLGKRYVYFTRAGAAHLKN